ncbi:MAG: histone [Candidatus Micrarchaeia archaeon]
MTERKFSLYDIEQFIREAGAEKVTEDAVLNLEKELEKLAESITNRAIRYAEHAGRRRLIKKSDILLTKNNDAVGISGISNTKNNYPLSYRRPKNLRPNARRTKSISIAHK